MIGSLHLTPDELANVVAAAFGQNGYDIDGLALYDDAGGLVGYAKAVVSYKPAPIKVRHSPEEAADNMGAMRSLLYPNPPTGIKSHGAGT